MDEYNDSIFNQEQHPNEVIATLAKKHNSLTANVKGLQNALHGINKDESREPQWDRMLMQAASQQAKMQVRAARDAYLEDEKAKVWEAMQVQNDGKINQILAKPIHERNKAYYDNLQKADPVAFWDTKVCQQRKQDKEKLGLAYHLKNGSK